MKGTTVLVIVLALLAGCKARKSGVRAKGPGTVHTSSDKKYSPREDRADRLRLPEDTGRFVHFKIDSPSEYVKTFSDLARREMEAYGIPASITLAQGMLESGFGKGELALKTNNHFGIKCHTGWQGDYAFHDDDRKGECFRKYNHPVQSFRDHSLFLTSRSRYAQLFELSPLDYRGWAHGLKRAGYATDRRYPDKLIRLIEEYRLYEYDKGLVARTRAPKKSTPEKAPADTYLTYVVKRGDTLYSISRRYAVTVADLKRWNRMRDNTLSIGQKLTVRTP